MKDLRSLLMELALSSMVINPKEIAFLEDKADPEDAVKKAECIVGSYGTCPAADAANCLCRLMPKRQYERCYHQRYGSDAYMRLKKIGPYKPLT